MIAFILCAWVGLSLKYLPVPYAWIGAGCFFLLSYSATRAQSSNIKAVYFNINVAIFVLILSEAFFYYYPKDISEFRYEGSYVKSFVKHNILGYAPKKGNIVHSKRYYKDQLLYDVQYTMDDNGLRRPFLGSGTDQDSCLLFFGGSFTFGEGVNDHEAIPYLVSQKSKYRSYNFGFHGYGPHQMLAALEQGLVREIIDCKPDVAIYQAIMPHIERSAGLAAWDVRGPRYVLTKDGSLAYAGRFNEKKIPFAIRQLNKSRLYRAILGKRTIDQADVNLFVEIIGQSRNAFLDINPQGEFEVILWDDDQHPYHDDVLDQLESKEIQTRLIREIIPDYHERKQTYLIPHDRHPNALAYRLISDYIVNSIVASSQRHVKR